VIDDALGDEVRVTVIAAGFEGGQPPRRQSGISRAADLRSTPPRPVTPPPAVEPTQSIRSEGAPEPVLVPAGSPAGNSSAGAARPVPSPRPMSRPADDDDLDVPDFLK
jgi:cell division protein FtsZ